MKSKPQMSPAFELFHHVRSNMSKKLSRLTAEHVVDGAVTLAIRSGLTFDEGDVVKMAERRVNGWAVFYLHCSEHHYAIACGAERGIENGSFCRSFEAAHGRKPFMVPDRAPTGRGLCKTGTRMHIGRRFSWLVGGETVTLECTSIDDEKQTFIGTQTQHFEDGKRLHRTRVIRRVRIGHDAIKSFRAEWPEAHVK